mmetsp:Transcript_24855/g.27509  ORF Transcript_24855/g.27509 Transcript_24855/m.27509 type:complete len:126 (-) Transcript_24855:88-465(-)|eukprot:CAMPEP_0205819104 /NCGR_PEP_ID=MMETSP0206-20130828/1315_1 /ASSEMBLY_ACC=CAM_ASM_000279 /TAXON_ID=36767 /ORGANISM="Euplotes focardii, Strain TN1" /LENGTH=125 /DNA_ID=CAMNT_0053112243 /DNA_START=164 /DNA_END=541 /DNA_ORIENTATION=+
MGDSDEEEEQKIAVKATKTFVKKESKQSKIRSDNSETEIESRYTNKGSTRSTSSIIESEDSEWTDPFEPTKDEEIQGMEKVTPVRNRAKGMKRNIKAATKAERKPVGSRRSSRRDSMSLRKRARN